MGIGLAIQGPERDRPRSVDRGSVFSSGLDPIEKQTVGARWSLIKLAPQPAPLPTGSLSIRGDLGCPVGRISERAVVVGPSAPICVATPDDDDDDDDHYSGLAGRTVEKLREYSVRPIDRYLIDIAAVRSYRYVGIHTSIVFRRRVNARIRARLLKLTGARRTPIRSCPPAADKENSFPREQVLLQLLAACYGNTP
ncbi:hypothetical protein K0M31_003914 [Melipona bicolor]|uniref:Uncharacterized protein n=1 Tax=Melipona bicolor TaxID=60889 RepID=A0AA40FXU0_9HYME|nr:hypothetical protein K0M31_003914 [Melipona bicolor]